MEHFVKQVVAGLCLLLMTACQSGQGGNPPGGTETPKGHLTLKTQEDREFLKLIRLNGTKEAVAKNVLLKLLTYSVSKRFSGISESEVEEELNKISIICEGNDCTTGVQ